MADSMILPEAEYSLGIGTAIKIPVPSLSLLFASVSRNYDKIYKNHKKKNNLTTEKTKDDCFSCLLAEHSPQEYLHDKAPGNYAMTN